MRGALQAAVDKAKATAASKKIKGKPGGDLRKSLAVSIAELPPVLIDHALQGNDFDTKVKPEEVLANESLLDDLIKALADARKTVENLTSSETCRGYIFAKQREKLEGGDDNDPQDTRVNLLYEDFHPFVPYKLQNDPAIKTIEFDGYNETVDEFFSSLEGQKLESKLTEREAAAKRKLDAARLEQSKRIEGLQEVQNLNLEKAAAIEANVERVQEAMDAVNGLLSQGMDWVDVGKLVEREKKRRNPVAELIKLPLKLAENIITLELAEEEFEEEEDDPYETDDDASDNEDEEPTQAKERTNNKGLTVDINLGLSPWANARQYFDQRKTAAVKEEKTQQQAVRALKSTEQKISEDLRKGLKQEKALLQPIRKQLWFEKFVWFISSDGYLVIGGKDAQQNELVYKRYLRKGDVYCHADLHGASSVIIKNNPKTPDAPIPPATLSQAGSLSVCSSEAWDSKAGMSAWWVNADQVTKSAPTGEFLPTGSFMIRGRKNFLPPAQLLLGLGIMFKVSEESKAKHIKHRLYDGDLPAGDEAVSSNTAPRHEEQDDEEVEHSEPKEEKPSDDESEGEQPEENPRDNPLQAYRSEGREEDLENVEEGVSELKVEDPEDTKTQPLEEPDEDEDDEDDEEEEEEPTEADKEQSSNPNKSSNLTSGTATPASSNKRGQNKRGKRGKAKKMAAKYKDQDEEDRAAAEALIGASVGRKKAQEEAQAKIDREAELAASKARRRAQHQRQQKEAAEHEETRKVLLAEGLDVLDESEASQSTPLDALVGTPLPGDEILEAIPVCAPWNALGRFKYKAKLQPGATKKGKAVKEVLERWKADSGKKGVVDESAKDAEKMWPREVELIKAMKPEETFNVVPVGKVRVMMSGGSGAGGAKKGGGGGGKGQGRGGRGGKGSKK